MKHKRTESAHTDAPLHHPPEGRCLVAHLGKESNGRAPVGRRVMQPGHGWRHLAGAVYEHSNGVRMHMLGLVRLPSGEFLNASKWPDCQDAARMIRINGGNRRRGLMAWAMAHNTESRGSSGNT